MLPANENKKIKTTSFFNVKLDKITYHFFTLKWCLHKSMKLKNILPPKIKKGILLSAVVLISSLLFSSQNNFNYLTQLFSGVSATITAKNSVVCKNSGGAEIIFKGFNGVAPYVFTYKINGGAAQTKTTDPDKDSKTIYPPSSSVGNFDYELIKVEDSSDPKKTANIIGQERRIQIKAPPVVDFSFDNNICSGESVKFTNNSTGTGSLTYRWNFGDGTTTSTQTSPNHKFNTALGCGFKTFDVRLTVTDANGCSSSKTKQVTVSRKPDIEFFDADFNSFDNCNNASLSPEFKINVDNSSASSSCIDSYFIDWDDGSTTTSATFPIEHTYQNIGVYQMKIIATGSNDCVNEVSYEIKNVGSPAGSIASPGNTSNLCNDNSTLIFPITNFENNSDDTTYIIDFGDGTPNTEPYTQAQIEDNNKIEHEYLKGSCSEPGGEFIATLSIQNACKTVTSKINSIIILLPSEAKFESIEKSCVNKNIVFSNKSIIGDNPNCSKGATFKWDFDGDGKNEIIDSNTTEITNQNHIYTEPGTYTVKLSVTSRCGTDTFEKEICIEPKITPTFTLNNDEGCIPFNVEATDTTDISDLCIGSTPIYEWTVVYAADNCGISDDWAFTNGTNQNSENPKFVFNTAGKYTLTQKITTDCGAETSTKVIDVKKPPTASINAINDFCQPGSINPTAIIENCTDNTAAVSYNWVFPGGTPASSTLENPGNISYDNHGIYTITLEVTNDCGVSNTATQTFEVFEKPVLTNLITTQEICSNQSTIAVPLTSSNSSTTYSWTATTVPNNTSITGFITNGSTSEIPSQTISNTGNVPGNVVYTVTPSLNGCDGEPVEVLTVIVNPTPSIVTQPVGSDICLDGAATTLEIVTQNGVGTPTYQWYSNINNSTSGGTIISGATNSTYDPPTGTIGEIFYYVVISFDGGCDDIESDVVSVNTVDEPTVSANNPSQTICVDGNPNDFEITLTGGLGNPTYQWFSNTTNSNTGGTPITGETASMYNPGVLTAVSSNYYYVEVTQDGVGCDTAISDVFTVNVVPDPVIDTQAITTQEVCQNASLQDLIVSVSGGVTASNFEYQWYSNTNNLNSGGTSIVGATTNTYTPDNTTVGTLYYYVVVKQTESGCQVISATSEVTITPGPSISTQPVGSDICLDGAATTLEIVTQNGVGTPTYQWYSNMSNSTSGGTIISGATNSTYDPPTGTIGEIFYYVVISFDGGCDDIESDVVSVNTVDEPTVSANNPSQTICVDGNPNDFEITLTGGLGNPTYQWFSNTTNSNTGGTPITGETASMYNPGVLTAVSSNYYYVEVTQDGVGCDTAISDVFTVNVVPDPVIDTQAITTQEVCQNASLQDLIVSVSGGVTASNFEYQWYSNTNNLNSGGTSIVGATTNTYTPDNTTVGTLYYYVVVKQTESGCQVISATSEVTITPGPSISTQPVGSDICLDGAATTLEIVTQNGVGTPTYQWYSNMSNSTSGGTIISGATNSTYDPPTGTIGEIFYYVVISFDGGCDDIESDVVSVNTVDEPTVSANNPSQTICVDGTPNDFEITLTGGLGNPTYQWFSNTTNSNTGGTPITGEHS